MDQKSKRQSKSRKAMCAIITLQIIVFHLLALCILNIPSTTNFEKNVCIVELSNVYYIWYMCPKYMHVLLIDLIVD